jgi:hypothetical protein
MLPGSSQQDISSLLDSLNTSRGAGHSSAVNNNTFDPIDFLNKHYTAESVLTAQLPALREAVSERMEKLDDRISSALQRQSETAATTRKHVQDAKASVTELEHRICQIKDKASQSEHAVLEITKDMKRLDCAKRHLQRTITTLKRLHMLVHAVEQLRQTCFMTPFPEYRTASHLIEATRLLLGHFSGYTEKVQPMRVLSLKVQRYQETLRLGLVQGFRVVTFGESRVAGPVMTVEVMQGGVLLFDALGEDVRKQFIHEFCQDHLGGYLKEFEPPSREPKHEKQRVSSFKVVEAKPEPEKSPAGLDQLEKRFTWYRDLLEKVNSKFKEVFPPAWNLQATMAGIFLQLVRSMKCVFVVWGYCCFLTSHLSRSGRLGTTFLPCWMGRVKIPTRTMPLSY